MNWESIIMAGLAGAIGGGVGSLIGEMVARVLKLGSKSQVRTVIVVIFVVGAISFLPPVLDRHLGETIRSLLPAPDYYAELAEEPFWQRILKDNPELEPVLKDRLDTAYASGGEDGVINALYEIGVEIGGTYVVRYLPLAHEDMIPKVINYYADKLGAFGELEQPLCYYWLFAPSALTADQQLLIGKIAADDGLFFTLIESAYNEMPDYDQQRGIALQTQSLANIQAKYGDAAGNYLAGTLVPDTTEQEALYCSVYYDLYKFMADQTPEDQINQFRYVFE